MREATNRQGNDGNRNARPAMLTVLCILSWIGSGLAAVSYITLVLSYDIIRPTLEEMSEQFPDMSGVLLAPRKFFLAGALFYLFSLAGITRMWNLRKAGFHLYTGAQIVLLLLPGVIIGWNYVTFYDIMLTTGFIAGYASQLKFMY